MAGIFSRAADVQDIVKRNLGGGVVAVELTSDHLKDVYNRTIRWFNQNKGIKKAAEFDTVVNQTEYAVESDVEFIVEVYPPGLATAYHISDVATDVLGETIGRQLNGGRAMPSDIVLQSQFRTERDMAMGVDFGWQWDEVTKKLILKPKPADVGTVKYRYVAKLVDANLKNLSPRDEELIERYATAQGKVTLGGIRAKFGSGFETAMGTVTLDGDSLKSEGQTEIETLDIEIKDSQEPMPFITG